MVGRLASFPPLLALLHVRSRPRRGLPKPALSSRLKRAWEEEDSSLEDELEEEAGVRGVGAVDGGPPVHPPAGQCAETRVEDEAPPSQLQPHLARVVAPAHVPGRPIFHSTRAVVL